MLKGIKLSNRVRCFHMLQERINVNECARTRNQTVWSVCVDLLPAPSSSPSAHINCHMVNRES